MIYLSLPLFIFFIGYLKPVFALAFSALLALLVYILVKVNITIPASRRTSLFLLLFSAGVVFIAGIGDLYFASRGDWLKHYLVLRDLIVFRWPVDYGVSYLLRDTTLTYYIGYYLVPALFGKMGFSWDLVRFFVYLYTVCGLFIGFYFVWGVIKTKKATSFIIFLLFGGLDIVGYFLVHGHFQKIGLHLEGWTEAKMQFSSMFTLISWVPQHAIPAFIVTPLVYSELNNQNRLDVIIGYISLTALWSIFTCAGLCVFIPLSVYITLKRKGIKHFLKSVNILLIVSVVLLLFVFLYYKTNIYSGSEENGFIWNYIKTKKSYWGFFLFYLLEVNIALPILLSILKIDRSKKAVIVWTILILNVIPLYKVGLMNDFVMRVSIPALIIVNVTIASYANNIQKKRVYFWYVICIMCLSSLTQLNEIYAGIISREYKRNMPVKNINELTVQKNAPIIGSQYFGSRSRFFFRVFAK